MSKRGAHAIGSALTQPATTIGHSSTAGEKDEAAHVVSSPSRRGESAT